MSIPNTFRATMASAVDSTATGTVTGDWIDVGDYSELYTWLDTAVTAASGATLVVTIQRQADNTAGYTTLQTHDTVSHAVSSNEETSTSLIGGRIRYYAVLGGTFGTGEHLIWTIKMQAKCA